MYMYMYGILCSFVYNDCIGLMYVTGSLGQFTQYSIVTNCTHTHRDRSSTQYYNLQYTEGVACGYHKMEHLRLRIYSLHSTVLVLIVHTHTHTHTHTHHKAVTSLGWIVHAGIGIQYLSVNFLICFSCTCVSMEFYMHLHVF